MPVPVSIEVEANSPIVGFEMMGRPKSLSQGDGHELPGGGTLYLTREESRRALDFRTICHFALHFGEEVGTGLIAAYLYDKLQKGRAMRLRIDRVDVQIDEGEIKRVLVEHIEQDKSQ